MNMYDTNITGISTKITLTFSRMRKTVANNLGLVITSLFAAQTASTHQIAIQMSKTTGKDFHTSQIRLGRFLDSNEFQVEDRIWRCHVNLIFSLLTFLGYLEGRKYLLINIDFTSLEDRFLILSAGLSFRGRSIPLYFTLRLYPASKGQMSQKKMESAFVKGLQHILPAGFKYVFTEDRGFCNGRFLQAVRDAGYDYIARSKENLKVVIEGRDTNLKDLSQVTQNYPHITIKASGLTTRLVTTFPELTHYKAHGWYLFTSLPDTQLTEIVEGYKLRFTIEKTFQDQKSSGFNLESSKIRKYMRIKRLLFCTYVAQALMMILGDHLDTNGEELKKKLQFLPNPISVYFN